MSFVLFNIKLHFESHFEKKLSVIFLLNYDLINYNLIILFIEISLFIFHCDYCFQILKKIELILTFKQRLYIILEEFKRNKNITFEIF